MAMSKLCYIFFFHSYISSIRIIKCQFATREAVYIYENKKTGLFVRILLSFRKKVIQYQNISYINRRSICRVVKSEGQGGGGGGGKRRTVLSDALVIILKYHKRKNENEGMYICVITGVEYF